MSPFTRPPQLVLTVLATCVTNAAAVEPIIAVNNSTAGYSFECLLNDEPICFGTDIPFIRWSGWPLKEGKNTARFVLQGQGAPIQTEIELVLAATGDEELLVSVAEQLTAAPKVVTKIFSQSAAIAPETRTVAHDLNDAERSKLVGIGLRLVKAIASGKSAEVAVLFEEGPGPYGLPPWATASHDRNEISRRSVSTPRDVQIIAGERFALLRPSDSYLLREPKAGLLSVMDTANERTFKLSYVIFARDRAGQYLVRGDTHGWLVLKP